MAYGVSYKILRSQRIIVVYMQCHLSLLDSGLLWFHSTLLIARSSHLYIRIPYCSCKFIFLAINNILLKIHIEVTSSGLSIPLATACLSRSIAYQLCYDCLSYCYLKDLFISQNLLNWFDFMTTCRYNFV